MSLASVWQTLAFPLVGAIVGLVLGLVVLDPDTASDSLGPWVLTLFGVAAVATGAWFVMKRGKVAPVAPRVGTRARPERRADAATHVPVKAPHTLKAAIDYPGVKNRYPDVWGVGHPFDVTVRVQEKGVAVVDARVKLAYAAGARQLDLGEAATGPDGIALFRFSVPETGNARIFATARSGETTSRAEREIRFVRYEEEIQSVFTEFREWVSEAYPEATDVLTVREMFQNLSKTFGAEAERALLEVTKAYELVTYGERDASRETYEVVIDAFAALERAGVFEVKVAN